MTRQRLPNRLPYRLAACAAAVIGTTAVAAPVSAATLFNDDFESYAAGSNLVGQGGWIAGIVNSVAPVNVGNYLSSQVLDGRSTLGAPENVTAHAVASPDAGLLTTLSFDAYATSDRPETRNTAVYLTDAPANITKAAGWVAQGPDWRFTVGSDFIDYAGGFDKPVKVSLVIDGPAREAFGTYDFGAGVQQTPHYTVSDSFIAALDTVFIYIDHRGTSGMEVDNLVLSAVPEPTSMLLMLLGLAGAGAVARQRRMADQRA